MAAQYPNIKIIFVPKFHCELNPIEGIWAFSKNTVRRKNDFSSLANFIQLLDKQKKLFKAMFYIKSYGEDFGKQLKLIMPATAVWRPKSLEVLKLIRNFLSKK